MQYQEVVILEVPSRCRDPNIIIWKSDAHDPQIPKWPGRDRLILSKGHTNGALCGTLAEFGFFPKDLLNTFNQLDSPFGMHPDMHKIPGCDMSTGSLGHGSPVAAGMALAGKADRKDYFVYLILGDGECQEGTVWERHLSAHCHLNNLIALSLQPHFARGND
jgi:transketolase